MQLHQLGIDSVAQPGNNPITNAESVILTLPAGVTVAPGQPVTLEAAFVETTGTATTAIALRIRRGTTVGGVLIGQAFTVPSAAAVLNAVSGQVIDNPGEQSGAQYVLTIQQTAATGNGATVYASLTATWNS